MFANSFRGTATTIAQPKSISFFKCGVTKEYEYILL